LSATEKKVSAPLSSNLETKIKFDQRLGVYTVLLRIIVLNFLSTLVLNLTVPLPTIVKVDSILVDIPETL